MRYATIITILLLINTLTHAQEVSEVLSSTLVDLDETLFNASATSIDAEGYSEATKYYRSPVSQRRRGVDWWIGRELLEGDIAAKEDYVAAITSHRLRLFGATKGYSAGGNLTLSTLTNRDWSLSADLDVRMGRDANIQGVFSQDFRGEFNISKLFGEDHYLTIDLEVPIMMKGMQGGASQEAITLTGDYLYNPAWGLYDGEVRNSRVRRYRVPELNLRYQLPIAGSTIGALMMGGESGRISLSRLGWYDGYNPTPDYYRKLPSYIANSDLRGEVEELWRDQNSEYTQIAWDTLVQTNQRSTDGEAHYIVEDQVEMVTRGAATLLLSSELSGGVSISYGAKVEIDQVRNFKEMNDLLGAEYLTDIDQYIGDYSHLSNAMQNNLREPNRKITEGDRFGYNYTLSGIMTVGIIGIKYHSNAISISLDGEFGEQNIERNGHYEKERFAGDLSFGKSKTITLPSSSARGQIRYTPKGRHSTSLQLSTYKIAPEAEDLFIQVQSANRVVDNPTSQSVSSINLNYNYSSPLFMVNLTGFFIRSRNKCETWQAYDDLSYTYTDVVVRDIGSTSLGIEAVAKYKVSRDLHLELTIAAGDYTYDTTPTVNLYDDTDMTLLSTAQAEAAVGCKVGNAPQLLTSISATYFTRDGFILSLDCSYAAGRYVAPSFMRRTDRVIRGTGSPEMEREIVTQSNLGSVFDLTIGVTKSFWLANDNRISLTLRVNNLLGDRDRIDYGRESNRILRSSATNDTNGYYLQPNTYYYETPRTCYLSCNFLF